MDRTEFIEACSRSGYATKKQAKEYAEKNGKSEFTEDDFIGAYRMENNFSGACAWYCDCQGGRTTAFANGIRGNSGIHQDWR